MSARPTCCSPRSGCRCSPISGWPASSATTRPAARARRPTSTRSSPTGTCPGPPTDVFSLAAVAVHALRGRPLWPGATADEMIAQAAAAGVDADRPRRRCCPTCPSRCAPSSAGRWSPSRTCAAPRPSSPSTCATASTPAPVELRAGRERRPPAAAAAPDGRTPTGVGAVDRVSSTDGIRSRDRAGLATVAARRRLTDGAAVLRRSSAAASGRRRRGAARAALGGGSADGDAAVGVGSALGRRRVIVGRGRRVEPPPGDRGRDAPSAPSQRRRRAPPRSRPLALAAATADRQPTPPIADAASAAAVLSRLDGFASGPSPSAIRSCSARSTRRASCCAEDTADADAQLVAPGCTLPGCTPTYRDVAARAPGTAGTASRSGDGDPGAVDADLCRRRAAVTVAGAAPTTLRIELSRPRRRLPDRRPAASAVMRRLRSRVRRAAPASSVGIAELEAGGRQLGRQHPLAGQDLVGEPAERDPQREAGHRAASPGDARAGPGCG